MEIQIHKKTRLIMKIPSKNKLPRVSMQPRNNYESSSMKTQNSKWHDKNAIMGDVKCLRQDLYL